MTETHHAEVTLSAIKSVIALQLRQAMKNRNQPLLATAAEMAGRS